jgi:hypothetical protein
LFQRWGKLGTMVWKINRFHEGIQLFCAWALNINLSGFQKSDRF